MKKGPPPSGPAAPTTTSNLNDVLESPTGRLSRVAAFCALLAVTDTFAWPAIGLVLVLTSLLPAHRRSILIVAALGVVYVVPPVSLEQLHEMAVVRGAAAWVAAWPLVVALMLGLSCAYGERIRRHPKSRIGKRPVLLLLGLLTALLIIATHAPLTGFAWFAFTASAMALSSYIWFFAYTASEARLRGAPPAYLQIGYWRPFWGFSNVPLGKGAAYLERVEARDLSQLAFAQLTGLRLMVAAAAWSFVLDLIGRNLYAPHDPYGGLAGQLLFWLPPEGLPGIPALVDTHAAGRPYPLITRWAAVITAFLAAVAHMASWGNTIMATCRMTGFNVAPNTDWPLASTSLSDFFNRYYYYFKELLAAFFFFPTYLRFFRSRPQLRLFFATLMAAGAGNFLYHFYRDSHQILRLGFVDALLAYQVYLAYAVILGTGIGISQIRLRHRRARPPRGLRRVRATAGVLLFYCLLNVLDVGTTPHTILDYAAFLLSLLHP